MRYNYFKFLICILFLFSSVSYPQSDNIEVVSQTVIGYPVIQNFIPKKYKAHNQNWAIVKDKRGVIYFGNSAGLLEFDGYDWNLIDIPNGVVRSLAVDSNGTIFIGSADDLGYLSNNKASGAKQFKSLLNLLPVKESIGHVWYTYNIDNFIFFITNSFIFRLSFNNNDYSNPEIKYWHCKVKYRAAFKVENNLFVQETSEGVLKYDNDEFIHQPGFDVIKDQSLYSMLPYDNNSILLATKEKGLYLYNDGKTEPFKSEANKYLLKNEVYLPGAKLPDQTFAFGTAQGGAIIIYHNGTVARVIDKRAGILDDGVLYIYYTDGKLWLALQNGISVIDLPSAVGSFDYDSGLKGAVVETYLSNKNLYAATTTGIFKLNQQHNYQKPYQFVQLPEANQEAWQFTDLNGQIFVVLTDGVYTINNDKVEKLNIKFRGCYSIAASLKYKNLLFVGTEDGLEVIEFNDKSSAKRINVIKLNGAIRNIYEDKFGNVWLGTSYNGLYKLKNFKNDYNYQPIIEHYDTPGNISNDEIKIFTVQDNVLFTTKKGVFTYNQKSDSLSLENKLGINEYLQNAEINYLLEDKNETIWISAIKKNSQLLLSKGVKEPDGTYKWEELLFLKNIIDFSNKNAVVSITKDDQTGIIWFSGADGIFCYDSNNKYFVDDGKNFSVLISSITLNGDSTLYTGNENITSLSPDFNSLRIKFSSLKYDPGLSEYQYKLEGLSDQWSAWTNENIKDYTKLPPGDYVFKVRARDIDNNISNEALFKFYVLSPWYLKWYSFLLYGIIIVTLVYLILKFRFDQLTKRNLKLESIISERTKLIREQSEKLEQLDEIKTKFFTNVSHEFRTPLTLIVGYIQQISEKNKDENLNDDLDIVRRNSKKLLWLINQLLDFSKLSSGEMKLKAAPQNIIKIIRSTMLAFSPFADKKNISFNLHTFSDEIMLYIDKDKIEKILTNIFSNAFKFTPEFGKIDVDITDAKDSIIISIADTGIGIPKEKAARIFDRFYQASTDSINQQEGSGIGLSLVKELVTLHKGKIEVESEEGRGTTFKIALKTGKTHLSSEEITEEITEPEINDETYYPESKATENKTDLLEDSFKEPSSKPRLLIVEDNFDVRFFIKENMVSEYIINEASDGIAGLNSAVEFMPDLIISDVMMPKMDGYQLCAKLKTDTRTSHIPVILLTAKAESKDKISGLETGADDYIVKPFEMNELKARIKNLIEQRKRIHEHFKSTGIIELEESSITSTDKKFLQNVYKSINENLSDSGFGVEVLSSKLGISRSVLHKKLVSLIGESPVELIRRIRLNKSAELIIKKFGNLSEISLEVGFNNPAYFSECFKKQFGVSPSQYPPKT
ncbi:MAG: hypothetical protein B6D44_15615 [Ignavibacteriales bacterium UTCHB2]|jgi:signal transduction histidine kinase/DNA-binding response OmpR family regulator/ligand-binding sensor domain-containing protein|nr:MAG: Sensor histidine kinase TodS [Ignavibacteria bacterium ADurb.Bin266]OQY70503.1 MAG: hypothetical protein B6D44_15615 [Ignavibacteriales bacterium UTCHB2]HQI40711.1 ATP-binding protein [Ignavibacteriaceae bacterium]